MKAILEFNLPDDCTEHLWAVHGGLASIAIEEFRSFLRNQDKYAELTPEKSEMLELIIDKFNDTFDEWYQRTGE